MTQASESSMSRQPLSQRWVAKIFQELQGNYGTRFLNQWKTGQTLDDGTDAGVVNAMSEWGKKLAGFADKPECIRRALDNLPGDPPSLPQFIDMCRRAPANEAPKLAYTPTPEDLARARDAANAAAAAVKKTSGYDPLNCWRRPASHLAVAYLLDGAKRDGRMAEIRDQLTSDGVIDQDGKAKKLWRDGAWVAA